MSLLELYSHCNGKYIYRGILFLKAVGLCIASGVRPLLCKLYKSLHSAMPGWGEWT